MVAIIEACLNLPGRSFPGDQGLVQFQILYVVQGMEDERTIPDERSGMSSNRTSYGELAKNFGIQNQLGIRVYE